MYRYLLLDFDNTLVDFNETERRALRKTFSDLFGRELSDEEVAAYHRFNDECWKMLERKEIDKPMLQRLRFGRFLEFLSMPDADVMGVNNTYMENLSKTVVECDGSYDACRRLSKNYRLFVITNGTTYIQKDRFAGASFSPFIEELFISDEIGVNKPAPEYFDAILSKTGDPDRSRYLVVGDSLTSDILFGKNIGVDTCFVGTAGNDAPYQIGEIGELPELLNAISDSSKNG